MNLIKDWKMVLNPMQMWLQKAGLSRIIWYRSRVRTDWWYVRISATGGGRTFICKGDYIIVDDDMTKHACGREKIFDRYEKI
jgi:hypothetical protein